MIVFVIGTGTDVGKTHVTAALGGAAWKAVATGVSEGDEMGDDARAIRAVEKPLYTFVPPISPHLAARQAGVTIKAAVIAQAAKRIAAAYPVLFVESAGGLFSPISNIETNFDVANAIGGKTLLVAPDRIGVLHDVAATVRDLAPDLIVLSAPEYPDASTGTNAEEIITLRLAKRVISFPRAALTAPETQAAAALVRTALLGSR